MLRWCVGSMVPAIMAMAMLPGLATANSAIVGDPEAGAAKAAVCAACHGTDGNSVVTEWPKIAGQHEDYAARQTRLVRDGLRDVPTMYPMVMSLSDQDIADISAYFAQYAVEPGVADEDLVEHGRAVYQFGHVGNGVPSCAGCHGPSGSGIPGAHYPMLAGQHADYTADRLRRYRAGEHNGDNDPYSHIMVAVARNLTDEDIEAVSSYIEGLHMSRWSAR